MPRWSRWRTYTPVAQRRSRGRRAAIRSLKKGEELQPVSDVPRGIAKSFWGAAWCDQLTLHSDWANRLPRGRTYVRNGSVLDLRVTAGLIKSLVAGSELYTVTIKVQSLPAKRWKTLCQQCSGEIQSVLDLMRGKLPESVIRPLTDSEHGLLPRAREISIDCTCPDYATMCKHAAATLYGVGHRLDTAPELLFLLRNVQQSDLVGETIDTDSVDPLGLDGTSELDGEDLQEIFGIDLVQPQEADAKVNPRSKAKKTRAAKKTSQPSTRKSARQKATKKKSKAKSTSKSSVVNEKAAKKKRHSSKKTATRKKTSKKTSKKSQTSRTGGGRPRGTPEKEKEQDIPRLVIRL